MIYSVTHITEYIYDDYVSYCHNLATLKPRSFKGQQVLDFEMLIDPLPDEISERIDFFGNYTTRFSIQHSHKVLKVTCKSKIERNIIAVETDIPPELKNLNLRNVQTRLSQREPELIDARQYLLESPLIRKVSQEIREYAAVSFHPDRPVFESAYELMQRIYSDFTYLQGFTTVTTPLNVVISEKKGVCQDFAQIAIACVRSAGLPARYVSGYIETVPPEGETKLVGADASHAWFSVFIPGYGWVDFDPTNNQIPSHQHITVAWGRDYYDVPPLKGVIFSNGENHMKVSVDIQQLSEYS